ncbi:hypothetical protein ACQ4PT_059349 [Festuca glaucescens]
MGPPQGGRRRRVSISSLPGGRASNLLRQATPSRSPLAGSLRSPLAGSLRSSQGGRRRQASFSSKPVAVPAACTLQPSPAGLLLDEKAWTQGRSLSPPLPEPSLAIVPVDEATPWSHPGFCNTLQCLDLLTCLDCGHCSEILEPFLDLSLEIDQVDNLVAALESFTKVEQIGDAENKLTCNSCNAEVCKDKRFVIDKAPDVVAFHLKRFTTLDGSIDKIDKHVAYQSELDLKPFHSNPDKEDLKYDLYALVEHSGLPNFSHYVCTIRSSPTSWHLMNDSLVHSISETSALGQEAYILFYVRQGSFPWFSNIQKEAKVKKAKAAAASKSLKSFLQDQISSRLMKGMKTQRKKCFVKELDSLGQNTSFGY